MNLALEHKQPVLPKRTPHWFKQFIKKNDIQQKIWLLLIPALATALGAFGGFPEPPKLFKQIIKFKTVKWFLLFILIWQGGGGSSLDYNDLLVSFFSTLIIYIIYNMPYVKDGSDYLEKIIKKKLD